MIMSHYYRIAETINYHPSEGGTLLEFLGWLTV